MPRKKGKKSLRHGIIIGGVRKGYSSRKIQEKLRESGLGLRRKELLREIRIIKYSKTKIIEGKKVTIWHKPKGYEERAKKSIPKKYRKRIIEEEQVRFKEQNKIYRMTLVIRDVPIHSEPFDRHYYGYHIFAFSTSLSELHRNEKSLKDDLIDKASNYVGFDITQHPAYDGIHIEKPKLIYVSNALRLNGRMIFRVEHNGKEEWSSEGVI